MSRSVRDEVLGLLAGGEPWTGESLAQRLGVGLRTVRRAVASLREEGVAIEADVGRGGGMRLARRAGLPRLRLRHEEAVELLLALALAESLRLPLLGHNLRPLRTKLAAALHEDERSAAGRLRQRILVGAPASEAVRSSWRAPSAASMAALQQAFVERRTIRFRYIGGDSAQSLRHAEPQYLLLNHPAWYLLAFDFDRQAGRNFRLDRIDRVRDAGEAFGMRKPDALLEDVDRFFAPL